MKYLSVPEAREIGGLRLALSVQSPGPWGIAARALFDVRGVPYVPVRQDLMQPNADLLDWTGRRNAPVAVYNDEPAVDSWLEIVNLAERLGRGPSLHPEDPVERALAAGFSAEICGAGGFGWSRRIAMMGSAPAVQDQEITPEIKVMQGYGVVHENVPAAIERVAGILRGLATQLHRQRAAGSDYLVGNRLSACDVHWACFSIILAPLAVEACEMSDQMHYMMSTLSDAEREAFDPILIEHRDRIWERHIGLPLDYLPD